MALAERPHDYTAHHLSMENHPVTVFASTFASTAHIATLFCSEAARAVHQRLQSSHLLGLTEPVGQVPLPPTTQWARPLEQRQQTVEEGTHAGAGQDRARSQRTRALTRADRMNNCGTIEHDEYSAAVHLRKLLLAEIGFSEGVGSYGDVRGSGTPFDKADRKAVACLVRDQSNRRQLADAIFAATGVLDQRGRKVFDVEMTMLLVASVLETDDPISLAEVGQACTDYTGAKQAPAAGGALLKHVYGRVAAHLGYRRLAEWNEEKARRLAQDSQQFVR